MMLHSYGRSPPRRRRRLKILERKTNRETEDKDKKIMQNTNNTNNNATADAAARGQLIVSKPQYATHGGSPARLHDVTDLGLVRIKNYPEREQVRLDFLLLNQNNQKTGQPLTISIDCSKGLSNKNKLTPLVQSLLGTRDIPVDVNLYDLVGNT